MNRHSIIVLILFLAATQAHAQPNVAARLDQVVRYFADEDLFAGSVLVARGDQALLKKAYGYANLEWKTPNTPETVFRIGSLTKQFTAAAILMLEQRSRYEQNGDLKLDDSIKKFFPNIPASWDPVTVRMLLAHTSGLPNYTQQKERWADSLSLDQMLDLIRNVPLLFPPGREFRYSNTGYFLLGAIIEKVSGEKYDRFLQENIFTPFEMKDSGYDHSLPLVTRRASGYNRIGLHEFENSLFMDMSVPYAAGALYSTTGDLWKWQQILYGAELFDAAGVAEMTTAGKGGYGYGMVCDTDHGRKRYWHSGGINGFNAFMAYFPEDKLSVIVLSNTKALTQRVGDLLSAVVHDEPVNLPQSVAVAPAVLEKYAGEYGEASKRPAIKLRAENGRLVAEAGELVVPLVSESSTKFFDKVTTAEFVFSPDQSGAATGLSLVRNGKERKLARVAGPPPSASLAGRWEGTFHWMTGTIQSVYTFEVKGNTFTGTLSGKDTPNHKLHFTDGKIDGDQISFSLSEQEKGWDRPQVTSRYTGTLEGNTLRLIYRNAEKRREGLPPKKGGNIHLIVATRASEPAAGQ